MGRLVKLVGSGIGLASEAIAARKQNSSSPAAGSSSSSGPSRYDRDAYYDVPDDRANQMIARGQAVPVDEKRGYQGYPDEKRGYHEEEDSADEADEEDWEHDDAVTALDEYDHQAGRRSSSPPKGISQFLAEHPPPPRGARLQRLPCPVIIPQRRPADSKRGFVRAYAPLLEGADVDQATFLQFLKLFHQESQSSPYLYAINGAAMVAGFAPSAIAQVTSIVVNIAAGAAIEVQHRYNTNTFLDKVNEGYFKPRGLYALIMTYKPESRDTFAQVDINKSIQDSTGPKTFKQNMKISSGTTYSQFELPEAAPLVFPALENMAAEGEASGGQSSGWKSKQKFVADYLDRRAQATFAADNPGSTLAVPSQGQFASRYSDPNHAANNGSLISLITGGAMQGRRARRRQGGGRIAQRRAARQGISPEQYAAQRGGGRRRGQGGPIRRMLKKDVLYLMIVNLPTEADKKAAEAAGIQVPGQGMEMQGYAGPSGNLEPPYARSSHSRSSSMGSASGRYPAGTIVNPPPGQMQGGYGGGYDAYGGGYGSGSGSGRYPEDSGYGRDGYDRGYEGSSGGQGRYPAGQQSGTTYYDGPPPGYDEKRRY